MTPSKPDSAVQVTRTKDRLAGNLEPCARNPARPIVLPRFRLLSATPEQKKQKQNWNRNAQEPQQNIPCRPHLLDSLFEFHIDWFLSLSVIHSHRVPEMSVWVRDFLFNQNSCS